MCLICQNCGELNENPAHLVCEACHIEDRDKWEDFENRMEFDEGWDCPDCRERGGECLPCKIAREDWLISMGEDPQSLEEFDLFSSF